MTSNVSDLVKVSPLEWEGRYDKYDGGKEYYGHGVFGHWYAVERAKAKVWHCMHHVAGEVVHLGYFTSLDEAKSAATADYESRILAALTPVPSTDTTPSVAEAAQVLLGDEAAVETLLLGVLNKTVEHAPGVDYVADRTMKKSDWREQVRFGLRTLAAQTGEPQ